MVKGLYTHVVGYHGCVWTVSPCFAGNNIVREDKIKWLQVTLNFYCILACDMLAGIFQESEQQCLQQGKSDLV